MTNFELADLWNRSSKRIDELKAKYRSGQRITRQDCDQLRRAVHRQGVVAYELWVLNGKPNTEETAIFQQGPPKMSPLPASMRPLNLTDGEERGGVQ